MNRISKGGRAGEIAPAPADRRPSRSFASTNASDSFAFVERDARSRRWGRHAACSSDREEADMSIVAFLILLAVAGLCGTLGQAIVGYDRAGCFGSIAIGFIGALLGMWIARGVGLPEILAVRIDGEAFPVVWSIFGSALFVGVLSLMTRRRRRVAS
jgi:uncharacterized membrane protein YeaQ/YmgE (transglycosylase-associated protein family)